MVLSSALLRARPLQTSSKNFQLRCSFTASSTLLSPSSAPFFSTLRPSRQIQLKGDHDARSPGTNVTLFDRPNGGFSARGKGPQRWLSNTSASGSNPTVPSVPSTSPHPDRTDFSALPPYTPPTTGLISYFPRSTIPYLELMRFDKPAGTYYLYFPCVFSTLLAAPAITPTPTIPQLLYINGLFLAGAFIMRSAGCTINDLWDRNLDPHVTRTRHRPIARGAISVPKATAFFGAQCLAGLAVLLQFPVGCVPMAVPSLALVVLYPLAKRVTYYPQFVLGLTFSWGALLGFPALMGGASIGATASGIATLGGGGAAGMVDAIGSAFTAWTAIPGAVPATALLYASTAIWTVLYDLIYAHMDVRDDRKAGIKSMIVAHGDENTKPTLAALAVGQIGTLAAAGYCLGGGGDPGAVSAGIDGAAAAAAALAAVGTSPVFYTLSCGGGALALATMIKKVKLDDPTDCWWWFRYGCWIVGGTIAAGLGAEYGYQRWRKGKVLEQLAEREAAQDGGKERSEREGITIREVS